MYKKKEEGSSGPRVPQEEWKGPPKRRIPAPPRGQREKIVVTVNTEIPPLPAKHEILPKPNWEANYEKEFKGYKAEGNSLKEKKVGAETDSE